MNLLSSGDEATQRIHSPCETVDNNRRIGTFTYDGSVESCAEQRFPVAVLCPARELAYFVGPVDADCEESLLKGLRDSFGVQLVVTLQQGVVYWQAAYVRLAEDGETPPQDGSAHHRDLWGGDRNCRERET